MGDSQRLNELFTQAKNQEPKTSFEDTKTMFKASLKSGGGAKQQFNFYSLKKLFIMTLSIVTAGISLFFLTTDVNKPNSSFLPIKSITEKNIKLDTRIIEKVNSKTVSLETQQIKTNKLTTFKKKEIYINDFVVKNEENNSIPKKSITTFEEEYKFPKLTVKQIEDNHKQKSIMLRKLARYNRMPALNNIDNRVYPMVYWHKPVIVGKASSINATNSFHIQATEVTNLQYRTFLFDLLIQGREDEFLKAKPNQTLWIKECSEEYKEEALFMKNNYFSAPEYNDYPVVAITVEGAEMYCKWLTEERNNLNPEKYGKLVNSVRLPNVKEWELAAKGKNVNAVYSSGKDVKNELGCYLVNFKLSKNSATDSDCDKITSENSYDVNNGFATVKVNSYKPNASGLFNMSGNVAEMVRYENNIVGAKGGNWMSEKEELKIKGEDPFKGKLLASVKVGFRPVITYLSKGGSYSDDDDSYRFPMLTPMQWDENNKIKAKIIKELSKFDKKKYAFIPSGTTIIKGKDVNINSFYMQKTEVSVLEYRTFLYDLLIQGRKDDFLIAKPDQKQWLKYGEHAEPMVVNYFSHPIYNDYPVNNVSKAGVELYCKWLNEEQMKMYGKNINNVRLPTTKEWVYAAKGGKEQSPYPWGGPYIRNSKGCFLANFKPGIVDSNSVCVNNTTMNDAKLYKEDNFNVYSADGGFYTVKTTSYNPNDFGLYCMSGNVAEMVLDENGKIVAKGGGWNSLGQQLQIEANNDFENAEKPNSEIGFRVVISYVNKK